MPGEQHKFEMQVSWTVNEPNADNDWETVKSRGSTQIQVWIDSHTYGKVLQQSWFDWESNS